MAVALSVVGYLLVPSVIGIAAGTAVQRMSQRRLVSEEQIKEGFRKMLRGEDPDQ